MIFYFHAHRNSIIMQLKSKKGILTSAKYFVADFVFAKWLASDPDLCTQYRSHTNRTNEIYGWTLHSVLAGLGMPSTTLTGKQPSASFTQDLFLMRSP